MKLMKMFLFPFPAKRVKPASMETAGAVEVAASPERTLLHL